MTVLPADQQKKLEGQLQRYYLKGCPCCGTKDWDRDDEPALLRKLIAEHDHFFKGQEDPLISMFCTGCGYLLVFFAQEFHYT